MKRLLAFAALCTVMVCTPLAADEPGEAMDIFDAMDTGKVDVTFVARDATRGRLVMKNLTNDPIDIQIPDAFAGVPTLQQRGGMGGMGGGMGGMGGGSQSVGGGGRGGGGRGGGGRGGGGGRFSVEPEKVTRVDVPLLCLDHGLKDPSSNKPYEIRPIENVVSDPAVIEIVKGFSNGELERGSSQAAVWHLNSDVPWNELASKLTGTARNNIREPWFSAGEMRDAMAIVNRARAMTAGQTVVPRERKKPEPEVSKGTVVAPNERLDEDIPEATEEAAPAEEAEEPAETEAA